MVDYKFVAICRSVSACQRMYASCSRMGQNLTQNHMLYLTSQYAATHKPGVDFPHSGFTGSADYDTDHAVIAEDVGEPNLQSEDFRIVLCFGYLRIGVAARRQIVLVGF